MNWRAVPNTCSKTEFEKQHQRNATCNVDGDNGAAMHDDH